MPKPTIICVDDEKIVLDSLKKELRNTLGNDYLIEVAESGEEALEIIDELIEDGIEIPLVIADYIMPEMKGDEYLIQVHNKRPDTRKIMLTGQATTEGVTSAVNNANLYRYIGKPWQADDMGMTVNEAIKSYYADKQLELRRKQLEEANKKLTKLDTAKTYFLGLLSHELNTPLIGINGNAKLIHEFSNDPDIKESAQLILDSEAHLRKFADLSLLITRIQTDKYDTTFYQEKLKDVIEQSIFNLKDKLEAKNIEIVKQDPDSDYLINIDVSLVTKVIDFVLDNSIKFSPDGSKINISALEENGRYKLTIIDKGDGFSEKTLENLFQFFASSDDLMSHSEGTGLSLAAAKVIMEMHNFDIKGRNVEGGGAEVEMLF